MWGRRGGLGEPELPTPIAAARLRCQSHRGGADRWALLPPPIAADHAREMASKRARPRGARPTKEQLARAPANATGRMLWTAGWSGYRIRRVAGWFRNPTCTPFDHTRARSQRTANANPENPGGAPPFTGHLANDRALPKAKRDPSLVIQTERVLALANAGPQWPPPRTAGSGAHL